MKNICAFVVAVSLLALSSVSAQEAFVSSKLEKIWTVSQNLDTPESAHYNASDNTIYISNIVGKPSVKDSMGYISKVNVKGEVLVKEWIKGLNAPKGIDCTKDKLYVTDIDRVVEIDLKTGKILKSYRNAKSKSLNDITVAADGRVYISDSGGNCIFYVGADSLEVFVERDDLKRMNGVYAYNNLLYLGSNGNFISINQQTKEIKTLVENVGYLDGIERIAEGKFVTSDWKGNIQLIDLSKGVEKLMDTTPINIYAADLGFIPSLNLLLIPTFSDNKLNAYKLKL